VRLQVMHNCGDSCDSQLQEEMRKCDVVILLFDIACKATLDKVRTKWHPLVEAGNANAELMLVGNKRDLRADKTDHVQIAEGEAVAKALGGIRYMETSMAVCDTWAEETSNLWRACSKLRKSYRP